MLKVFEPPSSPSMLESSSGSISVWLLQTRIF